MIKYNHNSCQTLNFIRYLSYKYSFFIVQSFRIYNQSMYYLFYKTLLFQQIQRKNIYRKEINRKRKYKKRNTEKRYIEKKRFKIYRERTNMEKRYI